MRRIIHLPVACRTRNSTGPVCCPAVWFQPEPERVQHPARLSHSHREIDDDQIWISGKIHGRPIHPHRNPRSPERLAISRLGMTINASKRFDHSVKIYYVAPEEPEAQCESSLHAPIPAVPPRRAGHDPPLPPPVDRLCNRTACDRTCPPDNHPTRPRKGGSGGGAPPSGARGLHPRYNDERPCSRIPRTGITRSECRVWDSNPHVLPDNGF